MDDAETALDLTHLEAAAGAGDVLGLPGVRPGRTGDGRDSGWAREVNGRIDEFLDELGRLRPGESSERRNTVLSRQKLITWLEEQFRRCRKRCWGCPRMTW